MLINRLLEFEKRVLGMKVFTPKDLGGLEVISYNPPQSKQKHYYTKEYEKKRIVLHYTVGNLVGDFGALTTSSKVSTAYLISREGKILQLFDPKYWAYHLGPGALGGNEYQSQQTIGIEISNYGWLERRVDKLYNAYGQLYCTLEDKDQYTYTPLTFRGELMPIKFQEGQYWANFTEAQYVSIKKLLKVLTTQFNIPYQFLAPERRLAYTNDVLSFKGIVTHVNYRKDKWDIGPNFDWSKIA